ncbi:hypothetical protein FGO68_gene1390 [Halteria grandinella]|uniref:Uncharacterized protein n=1 Tax=Halteria grandinella TaxID=5974 RepID=A0A8J8P1Q5_HALGN|nr:hypothetical protein FGO68_gene1390 [Halteria grandinella]
MPPPKFQPPPPKPVPMAVIGCLQPPPMFGINPPSSWLLLPGQRNLYKHSDCTEPTCKSTVLLRFHCCLSSSFDLTIQAKDSPGLNYQQG